MNARKFVVASVAASAALALGLALSGSAAAATAASGSAVVSESNSFFQQAAAQGIYATPLPSATGSYSSASGLVGTFPITSGTGSLYTATAELQLGGSLLLVDVKTGRAAAFSQLVFDTYNDEITGVPVGGTTAVPLLDPSGALDAEAPSATQTFTASDLDVDPAGASYLDSHLNTTFFTAGQSVGSLSVTYTPAS